MRIPRHIGFTFGMLFLAVSAVQAGEALEVTDGWITVHVADKVLAEPDKKARLEETDAARVILDNVSAVLRKKGVSRAGKIDIEITDYRLRSSQAAFWGGIMAGTDLIATRVTLTEEGKEPKHFEASASNSRTGNGAYRTRRMAKYIAKVIYKKMR